MADAYALRGSREREGWKALTHTPLHEASAGPILLELAIRGERPVLATPPQACSRIDRPLEITYSPDLIATNGLAPLVAGRQDFGPQERGFLVPKRPKQ
jgi:hypothetical protein